MVRRWPGTSCFQREPTYAQSNPFEDDDDAHGWSLQMMLPPMPAQPIHHEIASVGQVGPQRSY
jgi:hypothetical protein